MKNIISMKSWFLRFSNKTQNENVNLKIDHINLKQIQNEGAINLSDALAINPGVSVVFDWSFN